MILLEAGNKVLADTVADKLRAPAAEAKREPIDVRLCDFDDVTYRVVIEKNTPDVMEISMNLPCWGQIKDFGGEEALKTHYEGLIASESAPGYDVTLKIDFTQPIANPDELVQKISLLKTNLVGGVFHRHFNALLNGTAPAEPYKFSLHTDTSIYIFPSADRVTVVFTLDFTERVDVAVAKVFLQEFAESRRHLGSAPPCAFNVNPPMEMKHFNITEPQGKLGFISFAILKNHVDNNKLARVVGTLQNFRNYLQYHIKCSKSHFHARMRARVKALLKVLNRAKTDQDENAPKKTITGKTFVRK